VKQWALRVDDKNCIFGGGCTLAQQATIRSLQNDSAACERFKLK